MISILDVPEVRALVSINILRVAETGASKTEGSGIKDGRLLENGQWHVIRRSEASVVCHRGVKRGLARGRADVTGIGVEADADSVKDEDQRNDKGWSLLNTSALERV